MTEPDFTRAVPGWLVHRAAIAEVFITGATARGTGTFEVFAQLPRYHAFFHDSAVDGRASADPLALVEVFRQASIVVAHEFFAAPLAERFIWRSVDLRTTNPELLAARAAPVNLVVACEVLRTFGDARGPAGLLLRTGAYVDRQLAAEAALSFSWTDQDTWDEMRASGRAALGLPRVVGAPTGAPTPVEPDRVGRRNPYNVVIAPPRPDAGGDHVAELVVNVDHPTMFDHSLDHLPGTLLLEAVRQFAVAITDRRAGPTRVLSAQFNGFAELDLPACCRGRILGSTVQAAVLQRGRRLVEARVELAEFRAAGRTPATEATPARA